MTCENTHLSTLCVYIEKYAYQSSKNTQDFVQSIHEYIQNSNISVDEIWFKLDSVERSDIYENSDFSISNIPQTIRLPEKSLFGEDRVCRLSDISYENYVLSVSPYAEIRATRDFDNIGILCYTWVGRDDMRQLVTHAVRTAGESYTPQIYKFSGSWHKTPVQRIAPHSFLSQNFDKERIFEVNVHRNTAPLLMHELCDIKKVRSMRGIMIDAQEVQALYGIMETGVVEPRKNLSHSLLVDHELVTKDGNITEVGKSFLSAMHPSAKDPKFTKRKAEWLSTWDVSQHKAERWVKTWAGRLRRLQAKRWKSSKAFDQKVERIMAKYEDMRTITVDTVDYSGIISSRHFQEMGVREYDLCHKIYELTMRIKRTHKAPLKNYYDTIRDTLGQYPPVDGNYFWDEEVKDLACPDDESQRRMLKAFPDLWANGINAAFLAIQNGGCTMYSIIDAPMPDYDGTSEFIDELNTPLGPHHPDPHSTESDQETTTYPWALYVIRSAKEMKPETRAAHLAFRRGTSAVWHALMIDNGLTDAGLQRAKIMAIGSVRLHDEREDTREQ